MQSNYKTIIIIVATILFFGFFMPWFKFLLSISAWDIIFGRTSEYINSKIKYVILLIPATGLMIIFCAVFNNNNYPIPKRILFSLPLLIFIGIALDIVFEIDKSKRGFHNFGFENFLKIFGIGFWLTLITSAILPFLVSLHSKHQINPQNHDLQN